MGAFYYFLKVVITRRFKIRARDFNQGEIHRDGVDSSAANTQSADYERDHKNISFHTHTQPFLPFALRAMADAGFPIKRKRLIASNQSAHCRRAQTDNGVE